MKGLKDIHNHLSGSTPMYVMYRIAKEHGIKLPKNISSYSDFLNVARPGRGQASLDNYLKVIHTYLDRIQSSVAAVEECVFRSFEVSYLDGVDHLELRMNPFKRNVVGGTMFDVDAIIQAAVRGMDRAKSIYGMSGGMIMCMGREMDDETNEKIFNKCELYHGKGVVGIDIAGPQKIPVTERIRNLVATSGFTVKTCHLAEIKGGEDEAASIAEFCGINRIGHGLNGNDRLYSIAKERDIVFEVCPTSNISTGAFKSYDDIKVRLDMLDSMGIKYVICTDGGEMLRTTVANETALVGR